jgi:hypothetical protein
MTDVGTTSGVQGSGSQQLVATFADYVGAQHMVDRMSDDGFPVEHARIVGDAQRYVDASHAAQATGYQT